jgi:dTMP kinase
MRMIRVSNEKGRDASNRSVIPGGCLISVEGIDGCGKTTVAAYIVDYLRGQGRAVHRTRRPSDGPIGREIRRALSGDPDAADLRCSESAVALFAADLYDQAHREILPVLRSGEIVISDRWWASSVAYQGGSTNSAVSFAMSVNRRSPIPDLTLFLRIDPEVAAHRRAQKSGGVQVFDGDARQREVAIAYETMFASTSSMVSDSVAILDGSRDLLHVTASAASAVETFLAGYLEEVVLDDMSSFPSRISRFPSRGCAARTISEKTGVSEQAVRRSLHRYRHATATQE